ncbi:MAG: hypothetical protein M1828_003808 [Chrysothrix sp. TS-e1954]|nr:MAG: hypothetical protein M1828_003808 [Chrysothrix sp. TS-e1954]
MHVDFLAKGPQNFFNQFNFFDQADPTQGVQEYVSFPTASETYLIGHMGAAHSAFSNAKSVYLGLASNGTHMTAPRISSKAAFSPGMLLLADIGHMPAGCGTWPAMWMLGSGTWPLHGEIDIIENVNSVGYNQMTLHTGPGCDIKSDSASAFTGKVLTSDCDTNAPGQDKNAGCGIQAPPNPTAASFGPEYNKQGGGLWAMEWTTSSISIWYMPPSTGKIPSVLSNQAPNPEALFGKPLARFAGAGCDYGKSFQEMNLIFNTALCGDWAGDAWTTAGTCAASTGKSSCAASVASAGAGLNDAFWIINALRIYT